MVDISASGIGQTSTEIFLTETELALRQKRSVKTLQADRVAGRGVPFLKIGRSVRYRVADVIAFEQAKLRRSTSDHGTTPVSSVSPHHGDRS